jgi:hypothetical protein
MSDREANSDKSTLVTCDQRRYGSTQHGCVHGTAFMEFMENLDSSREDGVEGAADRDVHFPPKYFEFKMRR